MNEQDSLNTLGLRQSLLAIDRGECSPTDVIKACFDRIDEREGAVGAWQFRQSREDYLAHYQQHQAFYQQSLLQGLPIGIKDIIDTADMPTEMGSGLHTGRRPVDDAACVAMLRQAGGSIPGKTVTTEFAFFKPGKTANPHDLKRTPGGSSSGSAAAVADNMIPVALGSQTAASVIRPAAYCGVVGYVGSRGEFSLRGIQPLAQSLDSLGLMSRRIEDIELLRKVLLKEANPMLQQPAQRPVQVMICRGNLIGDTDDAMQQALDKVVGLLEQQGVTTIDVKDDEQRLLALVSTHIDIMSYEVARNLAVEASEPDALSTPLRNLIVSGTDMSRSQYLTALKQAKSTCHWLWEYGNEVDFILAPAAPGAAPEGLEATGAPHMSRPWQAMGLPVVALPGMTDDSGLPLGIQLIGRRHSDESLLNLARWLEGVISCA